MSLRSYISKTFLALRVSRNFSFVKLLINSKKFSRAEKAGKINLHDEDQVSYDLSIGGRTTSVLMRTYKGDINIFYEIFWRKMYQIPKKFIQNPKVIVDLGAHVGFTSIFFSSQYPAAKVIAVEASGKNYDLLQNNIRDFINISSLNKAIYTNDGLINFAEDGILSYNTRIDERGTPMASITMETLIKQNLIERIDLLKIDIEGAEAELLSKNNEWLNLVDNIIIELHNPYDLQKLKTDVEPFGFKMELSTAKNLLKNIFLHR